MITPRTAGSNTPFARVAEAAMRRLEFHWKPGTAKTMRSSLRASVIPFFEGLTIGDVCRRDVEEWYAGLHRTPAAANKALAALAAVMRVAEEVGVRPKGSDPTSRIRRYRPRDRLRALSADQMARLGTALDRREERHPVMTAMVRLVILTGCRIGELRHLRWSDYRDGLLHIQDGQSGPRTVYLCSNARIILDGLKTRRTGLVFPPPRGNRQGMILDTFWKGIRQEIGLYNLRIQDLRHHYACTAVRGGEHLVTVGNLLGHVAPNTTLRYALEEDAAMREAVRKVDGALAPNTGPET